MDDKQLFDTFRVLDASAEPDLAFADTLFETLAGDLGFRADDRRRRAIVPMRPRASALRLAYVAAILGLLLAAALAAALLAGALLHERTAAEIVAASQAMQLEPPAYDMTVSGNGGSMVLRVRTNGHDAWRWDWISSPELAAGTFEVHDGTQVGRFDAADNTWTVSPDDRSSLDGTVLTWALPHVPTQGTSQPNWFICPSWTRLPDDAVAGRPAYHVACDKREFWVDQATFALVGVEAPSGEALGGFTGRATAFDSSPDFSSGTFAMAAPPGAVAVDPNNPPVSTVLVIGQPAPRISGATLDGTTFDTSTLSRPAAVYVWGPWCDPCAGSHLLDLQSVAERHASTVSTMTVAVASELGTVTGYVESNGIRLPVINDGNAGTISTAWKIQSIPALVMLDRNGVVVGIRSYALGPDDLERAYAALEAGLPVPTPEPTPTRSFEPPPTYAPGATETVSGLALDQPAPAWSGPLLGGGTLDASSLAGKPTVIWFGLGCADCPTTDLQTFDTAHRALGESANLVVIASGEPTPGWTAALFRRLGLTVPLVFDWDGHIERAFEMTVLGTVVFDSDGRLATATPGGMTADEIEGLVEKLSRTPSPSPGS